MNIKVRRINKLEKEGKVKAFVELIFEGSIIVKGFRIVEGKNGLFLAMPSEKGKEDKFYNTVEILDMETKSEIEEIVMGQYNKLND